MTDPNAVTTSRVVQRYYATVADLNSTEDDLRRLLAPDLQVLEQPNATSPKGAVRDLDDVLQGFRAGKALLADQAFDVHEVLVVDDRAAVRATWRGVVAAQAGRYQAGQELIAHIASFLTVRNGAIVAQETFDCFVPQAIDETFGNAQ